MRQAEYKLGMVLGRKRNRKQRLLIATAAEVDKIFIGRLVKRLKRATKEVRLLRLQTRIISSTVFSINVFTGQKGVH